MCCFSPVSAPRSLLSRLFGRSSAPPVRVANTSIFARRLDGGRQALAYSMQLSSAGEVAMILPLPVRPGAGDDGATFLNLERHPRLFDDLNALFLMPMTAARGAQALSFPQSVPKLVVHQVGSFEASFVPAMRDFSRLDERFRIPDAIWRQLGGYDDYGFAVFRLKPGKKLQIHPMALRFESRDSERLFFPTVHVHDGKVHAQERFDHALYFQRARDEAPGPLEDPALQATRSFLTPAQGYEGLLVQGRAVYRRELRGLLPNQDTWIAA